MSLQRLMEDVYQANIELVDRGLVVYTWGNVSGIDRERGLVVIKPRGVDYGLLCADDMSVVDMDGKQVEGALLPSVDLDIHLALYRAYEGLGGIAHTHSRYATAFAQALRPIQVSGTTHADHFRGDIPCTPYLTRDEVEGSYEDNLGRQIVAHFAAAGIDPMEMGAVLAGGHGPFTWGRTAAESVEHSVILEEIAKISLSMQGISGCDRRVPRYMSDRHYLRKYGPDAYFYQEKRTG